MLIFGIKIQLRHFLLFLNTVPITLEETAFYLLVKDSRFTRYACTDFRYKKKSHRSKTRQKIGIENFQMPLLFWQGSSYFRDYPIFVKNRWLLFSSSSKKLLFLVVPDVVLAVLSGSTSSGMDAGLAPEGGTPSATMATHWASVWKKL